MTRHQLLLLHGALGSSRELEPVKTRLSENYDIHTLDFSGHGGNHLDGPFTIDRFTYDVIHYLDEKRIPQVHIFGFSMGGYVALKAAERLGLRIGKIVTLGTKFDWNIQSAQKETALLQPERIRDKVPHFAERLKQRHAPADWKNVVNKTREMINQLGHAPEWTPGVNFISNPVRLLLGGRDNMVSADETRKVADHLRNASIKILPGMEHPLDKVDFDILKYEIDAFLNEKA